MRPIPETIEAIDELDAYLDDGSLLDDLQRSADRAQAIAPDLAGLSVAARSSGGVTFTLVATDEEVAALDGMQYLASGPCVDAAALGHGIATTSDDFLSEHRWRAFGLAAAAAGVRSSLTFPVLEADVVIGTVNLYGRSDRTFEGKHEALAEVFRAWAPGAVTNADLSFSTRRVAQQAPEQLRDDVLLDTATGILSAIYDLTISAARDRLAQAADRAGVPVARFARSVIDLHGKGLA